MASLNSARLIWEDDFMKVTKLLASVALVGALVSPAYAQDAAQTQDATAAADEPEAIHDIVVTAQFREQRLQDTPLAITAVDSELLEARGQTDIAQVASQAPNVTLRAQPQSGGIGLIAFIRGVGQTDFNYALEPGVGIYVDDVYIPTLSSSLLDLMDLDRIEVLRGPQGTLAGKNSIGGAIKLFSQKPEGSGKGSLQATYGSYNRIDVRGMMDIKLAEGLSMRVSGATKNSDGYVTLLDYGLTHPTSNVLSGNSKGKGGKSGELGGRSFAAGKVALRWEASDAIEVNLSGDYTREKNDAGAQVLLSANASGTTPDGIAFLAGKNGAAVPYNCAFVPVATRFANAACAAQITATPAGYNAKFINYANFVDGRTPTTQAPYKPYAATNQQTYNGWGVMGNVTAKLSDNLEAVWISSYRKYEMNFGFDQDGSPVPVAQLDNRLSHHAWSQELRLNGKLAGGKVDFTLGGFFFKQNGNYNARVDLNYAGIDFIHGPDTTPSTSKAVFLNTTFHATDAFNITAGVRQSWDKKDYTYFRSNPDGTVPFGSWTPAQLPVLPICEFFQGAPTAGPVGVGNTPNCLLTGLYNLTDGFKGKRTDWRVVADYRFSPAFLAYASVATGYKGGGVNPRPFFGPSAGACTPARFGQPCNQLKAFNPETIMTYEIGFKSDLLDRKLRINGAAFFNKYKDIILTLTSCNGFSPCLQPNNVGKADVKGFELEVNARPAPGLMLDGSLSYLDFKYKSTGTSGVPLANSTPYTPKWTYSFGIQYDYQMKAGTVGIRFDGSYQSNVFSEAFNGPTNSIGSRFLGNARLSYTTDNKDWQVSAEVQNVFNKYYYNSVEDVSKVGGFGAVTASPGLPRTWAVTVKRNF
jgi:iron complex outermembrane recepter protein